MLGRGLAAAFASRDAAAFAALFASTPTSQALAERLWGNWTAMGVSQIRPNVVGFGLWWRLNSERGDSLDDLTIVTAGDRIAQIVPEQPPAPLWLIERIGVRAITGATALAAATLPVPDVTRWVDAAAEAEDIVNDAELGPLAAQGDAVLRLSLPSSPDAYRQAVGLPAADAAATQAVTILNPRASNPRIIVNPATTGSLDDRARRTLLVHEGVHAFTRSALSTAPLWTTEGLAESIAQASDPATRARNRQLAIAAPAPSSLPTVDDLNGPDALTAYALAVVAVDGAIHRWGRPAMMGWMADWSAPDRPSDDELTAAYRAALGR